MKVCVSYTRETGIYVIFNFNTAKHTYTTKADPSAIGIGLYGAIDPGMYDLTVEDKHVYNMKESLLMQIGNKYSFEMLICTEIGDDGFKLYNTLSDESSWLSYSELYHLLGTKATIKGVYINESRGISFEDTFFDKTGKMHNYVFSELVLGRSFGRRKWL